MKKVILLLFAVILFTLVGCESEDNNLVTPQQMRPHCTNPAMLFRDSILLFLKRNLKASNQEELIITPI